MKTPILKLAVQELVAWFHDRGEREFRAKQLLRWIFRGRASSFQAMTDLPPAIRDRLEQEFSVFSCQVESVRKTTDDTRKLLLRLRDSQAVETVLMTEGNRRTVCVSTQVGCGMG